MLRRLPGKGRAGHAPVLYCPDKKLYSFTLDTPALRQLGQAAEVYVTAQLERSFRTLDYYKSILPQEEPTYD